MSEHWDRVDGEDLIGDYLEEEDDFGEDPFGEYDLKLLFLDEPIKVDKQLEVAKNALKPNPKLFKDKRRQNDEACCSILKGD